MNIKKIFGENLKKYRKAKGFTQIQIAEALEVDQKHISFIENGNSFPSATLIGKITEVLNIEPQNLFFYQEKPSIKEMKNYISNFLNTTSDNDIEKIYNYIASFNIKKQI